MVCSGVESRKTRRVALLQTKDSWGAKFKKAFIGGIAVVLIAGFAIKILQYVNEITLPLALLFRKYIGNVFGLEAMVGLSVILAIGFSISFIGRILPIPVFKQIRKIRETVDRVSDRGQIVEVTWGQNKLLGYTAWNTLDERGDYVLVFIPTSPVPATGITVAVNKINIRPADITPKEYLSIIVSGGMMKG